MHREVRSVLFIERRWGGREKEGGGGRSPVASSFGCFRRTNKGLDGVVGTELQWRAGGLFTIITPSR